MLSIRRASLALFLTASLSLTACASMPQTPAEQAEFQATNDPFEPTNRVIFDVNDFLDRLLFRPVAELYRVTVPPMIRDRIAGVVKNMSEPVVFANNVLQGEVTKAGKTAGRFLVNTTIGGAGMFDVASDLSMPRQTGDFGQTLYVWGLSEGPYLVLPFFGPSNVRDAVGLGADSFMSPWKYLAAFGSDATETNFMVADFLGSGVVTREENIEALDALRKGSLDFYAQMRSVYRQHRAKKIGAPAPASTPSFSDYEPNQTPIVH